MKFFFERKFSIFDSIVISTFVLVTSPAYGVSYWAAIPIYMLFILASLMFEAHYGIK